MESNTPRHHKLFFGSSYDRGLDSLLFMWPDIIEKYPDAELHICYGWNLFDIAARGNSERQQWKKNVESLMNQQGIVHHGRVGKSELTEIRSKCGIWAYPTYFTEINCITALEAQSDGLVPVVCNFKHKIGDKEFYTALDEVIGAGIKVDGPSTDMKIQEEYSKKLIELMGDKETWKKLSLKSQKFVNNYYWPNIARKWSEYFDEPLKDVKVSIITPTIREGWWNIMADNISKQSHKNIEWLILDDHKEDRSKIAGEYVKKYDLNIKYIRGSKAMGKYDNRHYGLVRANNIGWQQATGELCVWLQDFIVMPEDGIERLVDVYRHNPDALIAPTDVYYGVEKANQENKEDWWDGKTDVLTNLEWKNVRNKQLGLRESDNPFDYEANYGAIPRKILQDLNGWWEFMDDGLGYDNTEIAYRALKRGYRILVDDTNVAKCINLWPIIGGTNQNVVARERTLNPPRYKWLVTQTEEGKLPLIRDVETDKKISLPFTIPAEVKDEDCAKWIEENKKEIIESWSK